MVFRVKKTKNYTVMSNYHLRDMRLSLKAKGLLSQMLSLPEDWNYTVRGLAAINKETFTTIRGVIIELERAGYIVRRQRRETSGEWKRIEYDIYEIPQSTEEESEASAPETEVPPTPAEVSQTETEVPRPRQNAPKLNEEALNEYRREIRENVNFERLWRERGEDIHEIAGIVEMLAEVCAGTEPIRVRGQDIPAARARERFLSLEEDHILYFMESMRNTHTEIKNIRAYTLAALYNAPTTIDQYYKTLAQREDEREEERAYQGYQPDYRD